MPHTHQTLSAEDIDHFTTKVHVVVKNCFDRTLAKAWIDLAYQRLGYHPDAPQT